VDKAALEAQLKRAGHNIQTAQPATATP